MLNWQILSLCEIFHESNNKIGCLPFFVTSLAFIDPSGKKILDLNLNFKVLAPIGHFWAQYGHFIGTD